MNLKCSALSGYDLLKLSLNLIRRLLACEIFPLIQQLDHTFRLQHLRGIALLTFVANLEVCDTTIRMIERSTTEIPGQKIKFQRELVFRVKE